MATKIIAKATALWMLLMSFFIPIHHTTPLTSQPSAIHQKKQIKTLPAASELQYIEKPLYLHTFEKQYTFVFAGKVSCGEAPCNTATIQIRVSSKKNPTISKTVSLQPDGSYEVSFILKEYLHEHLDWWIVADSPDSASKQMQGREILMDDADIRIEQPLALI